MSANTEQKGHLFSDSAISDIIKQFFREFQHGKYIEKIDSLSGSNLLIEFYDLFDFDTEKKSDLELHKLFMVNTKHAIQATKRAVKEIYAEKNPELADKLDINILIDKSELDISVSQAIKNKFVNKLISVQARTTGESEVKTRLVKGVWTCPENHYSESLVKPYKCSSEKCTHRDLDLNKTKS